MKSGEEKLDKLSCAFCLRTKEELEVTKCFLIAGGRAKPDLFICSECVVKIKRSMDRMEVQTS